jgi:hypothetical protein
VAADTLEAIMNRFAELKEALGWKAGDDLYTLLKNQTKSDARVNVLWRLLDTKKAKVKRCCNNFGWYFCDTCH